MIDLDTDDRISASDADLEHLWTPTSPLGRVNAGVWSNGWTWAVLNAPSFREAR
jgi:hypothetical protein